MWIPETTTAEGRRNALHDMRTGRANALKAMHRQRGQGGGVLAWLHGCIVASPAMRHMIQVCALYVAERAASDSAR